MHLAVPWHLAKLVLPLACQERSLYFAGRARKSLCTAVCIKGVRICLLLAREVRWISVVLGGMLWRGSIHKLNCLST
jgi:hypothetical protein